MTEPRETYLGDGLYASWDGFQVKLRAPREHGDHEVYLEPVVLDMLITWLAELGVIRRG
jgi:hypothetical protein